MASTRTYESALNTECDWKELGTYLDGVLVGEEVDDLKRVRDNADGQELLSVVATLHHQARYVQKCQLHISTWDQNQGVTAAHLSTNRSTMGI